jgi:hypothetical protein
MESRAKKREREEKERLDKEMIIKIFYYGNKFIPECDKHAEMSGGLNLS